MFSIIKGMKVKILIIAEAVFYINGCSNSITFLTLNKSRLRNEKIHPTIIGI